MRNNIVAGNWKMNNDSSETEVLLTQLKSFKMPEGVRIMVAPAFTQLAQSTALLKGD
ncbi:MAG: triose-phosphate isomerase, partial [Flavobacteriaceae bacterium]|nr:triose-phosphate isomerase [Flavobacteriaceae bacterium]